MLVPEEPPSATDVNVVVLQCLDSVVLPCHITGRSYDDRGVHLHLAFCELGRGEARFVAERIELLRSTFLSD